MAFATLILSSINHALLCQPNTLKTQHYLFTKKHKQAKCRLEHYPSKHVRSDLEVSYIQSVMTIMASVQPELGRIIYMLDPASYT